jgi:hypothetical protein
MRRSYAEAAFSFSDFKFQGVPMSRSYLPRVAVVVLTVMTHSLSGTLAVRADEHSCFGQEEPKRDPSIVVASISKISEAIARETNRVFEPVVIRQSATFKALARTGSLTLWNELIVNSGGDLVLPIVGLMCVEDQRPGLAFDAAAKCIILSQRPANPTMGYAVAIVAKGATERGSTDRIARMIENGTGSDDGVVVLLASLCGDDLVSCLDALDVDQCAATRLAWVVSSIGEKYLDGLEAMIKSKYLAALEKLADTPGVSRCTYLSLVDEQAKKVKECLRLAILDPDVKEMHLIPPLRRFGKVYAKDIEGWLASTSEKRQTFVKKTINR